MELYDGVSQGSVALRFDLSALTKADVLESAVLRITNAQEALIRRYEPASEMPEELFFVSGSYGAELILGSGISATFELSERSFMGRSSFQIVAGEHSEVDIECSLQSATIEVLFGDSISSLFEEGYSFTITNGVGALVYRADGSSKGYFTVPEGVTQFGYEFRAVSRASGEDVITKGTMSAPQPREEHQLTLNFSTYLDITSLKVTLDDSTDDLDDSLAFSPQPTMSGVGFEIGSATLQADGSTYSFSVTSIKVLRDIKVEFDGGTIELLKDGNTLTHSALSYTPTDNKSGIITLQSANLDPSAIGGTKAMLFTMTDTSSVDGTATATLNTSGALAPRDVDYWHCSATLQAQLLGSTGEHSVQIAYRVEGAEDWKVVEAAKLSGSDRYEALAEAEWVASESESGNTIYRAKDDIRSGKSYEVRLVVDGEPYPTALFTIESRSQEIPYADMSSSSLPCFGTSGSSSATWASGNNTFVKTLCTHGTKDGESVAVLAATSAASTFAAGNIALGQFTFNGIISQTGTLAFGQPFDWTTRPKSFKVRYAATISTADYTDSTLLPSGSIDRGRVYMAIVDWSSRHGVTSGSGSPSGVWDPAVDMELSEGRIIGYGSAYIDESTSGDGLHDLEMEVVYYDPVTKPSSNITLVVSAVTSCYGDYLIGSTSNKMWVRDFEFGY